MVEFILRLAALAGGIAVGLATQSLDLGLAWKVAAGLLGLWFFSFLLERRGLKTPAVATFVAVVDALAVAMLLASAGYLRLYGFLVLAPGVVAVARHGVQPGNLAPLLAIAIPVANMLAGRLPLVDSVIWLQAGLVLALAMLLAPSRVVVTVEKPAVRDQDDPRPNPTPIAQDDFLELRESYRALRDTYRDLERKSRRDRIVASIADLRGTDARVLYPRLAARLREFTGAEDVALYTLAQFSDTMVVQAATASFPASLETEAFSVSMKGAQTAIRDRLESAIRAVPSDDPREFVNVLLVDSGKVLGMICLLHGDPAKLEECRQKAEECAPVVTSLVRDENREEAMRRRLRQAELLYELATIQSGATTASNLAARVAKAVMTALPLDHVGIHLINGDESIQLAHDGASVRLLDAMSFASGPGMAGWVKTGCPELALFDAREDARVSVQEALKRRVGSFYAAALEGADGPAGYLTAATHRVGGIDADEVETLRLLVAELARALSVLQAAEKRPEGLMTMREFQRSLTGQDGTLVVLEVLRRDALIETFGRPALEHATRKLAHRLRTKLPPGGAILPREFGEFLVYLPLKSEDWSTSWANEAAATASMIGVRTLDGTTRIPLAMRAKVAPLNRLNDRDLEEIAA